MKAASHSIPYGSQQIEFELSYVPRKTLGITVHPDLRVEVRAPEDATYEKIREKVEKRARWITKQQRYFENFLPRTPPREYVSGETHLYLGKQYRLRVLEGEEENVKLYGGRLYVHTHDPQDRDRVRGLLSAWYKAHAEKRFRKGLQEGLEAFQRYELEEPTLEIRRMPKRWGSCSKQGRILLNPELIKAPSPCIDYVILHELCHLVHPRHDKGFYRLLSKVMPEWRRWKERLEGFG
jgi:hypothetical protein